MGLVKRARKRGDVLSRCRRILTGVLSTKGLEVSRVFELVVGETFFFTIMKPSGVGNEIC